MGAELEVLEDSIGHSFRDRGLLRRALTHKSFAYEESAAGRASPADNERLEFLGDSILGFLISELMLQRYPTLAEGRLSRLTAHYVSATHLHEVAVRLDLGRHLLLGHGEDLSGGRAKKALLADALEALIAAIYLDAGLEPTRRFVIQQVAADLEGQPEGAEVPLSNFKSALQEYAHARRLPHPRYVVVGETGPEHAKTFIVEVHLGREWSMQGEAPTKKAAGQKAAQLLLEKLKSVKPES
ncbi:MAG: ribonuclease III [Bryobacteraceae bacterium]